MKRLPPMCWNCCKAGKTLNICKVLTSPWAIYHRYGECFAWTDNPNWEAEVAQATAVYSKRIRGV